MLLNKKTLPLLLIFALVACDKSPDSQQDSAPPTSTIKTQNKVDMRKVTASKREITQAFLRSRLPDDVLAYMRLPLRNGQYQGHYAQAYNSQAFQGIFNALLSSVNKEIIPFLDVNQKALAQLFLSHGIGPVELMLLPSKGEAALPELFMTQRLDFTNHKSLNAFLAKLSVDVPNFTLVSRINPQGSGVGLLKGLTIQFYHDLSSGHLFLSTAVAKPKPAKEIVVALQSNPDHSLFSAEQQIDEKGQGLFIWLNPVNLLAQMYKSPAQGQAMMLTAMGAGELKGIALGMGHSQSAGRLKLILQGPHTGLRQLIPSLNAQINVSTAGTPKWAVMLGLPNAKEGSNLFNMLFAKLNTEQKNVYLSFKKKLGFDPMELLAVLGPEIISFSDEAGINSAIRIKNGKRLYEILDRVVKQYSLSYQRREIKGHTYHHLIIPSFAGKDKPDSATTDDKLMPRLLRRVLEMPSHIFWTEEGDYLIAATTPQTLIDRNYIAQRTNLGDWLRQQQHIDSSDALLMASASTPGLPKTLYELNLAGMLLFNDFTGQKVDPFSLPTARELNLPDSGSYSFKLASNKEQLSLELVFEENPLEILVAGGNSYTAVAVIGILAAIAVPAYQDYTHRAEVAAALVGASQLKQQLAKSMQANKRFPKASKIKGFNTTSPAPEKYSLSIDAAKKRLQVKLNLPAYGDNNSIYLTPELKDGAINWRCSGSLNAKYLPRSCRQ